MISFPITIFMLTALSPVQSATGSGGSWEELHRWSGEVRYGNFGRSVSQAGDINGDGFGDLIIGAPWANHHTVPDKRGAAYVYSGKDGALLFQWKGENPDHKFGQCVSSAGDVNRDGVPDLIVGAPHKDVYYRNNGTVFVYSGADGGLLYQFSPEPSSYDFGCAVSGAGDVDADGFDDLIIGAEDTYSANGSRAGAAYVYSGRTGALLHGWYGEAPGDNLGNSVSGGIDINQDGFDDLIVGIHCAAPDGRTLAGSVKAFSGKNGDLIYKWDGEATEDFFGNSVSSAGDVNNDGIPDIIIGAHGFGTVGRNAYWGKAYVYSGADGSLLYSWVGADSDAHFGKSVSGAGDVNGDGFDDLIIGTRYPILGSAGHTGSAFVYSGIDGSLLKQWQGKNDWDRYGASVSGIGDGNGDGRADIIVGAPGNDQGPGRNSGIAYVYSFDPYFSAQETSISALSGGTIHFDIDFPEDCGSQRYRILISASGVGPSNYGVDIPLAWDTMMMNSVFCLYPGFARSNLNGSLDQYGNASGSLSLPAGMDTALIGTTYHFAAITNQTGHLPNCSSAPTFLSITP